MRAPWRWVPLWKRKVTYPLYWKGDPQLRLFTPSFWMKMIKPETRVPSDTLVFHCHMQMTTTDVKNYLEKIYDAPVCHVRTEIRAGDARYNQLWGFDASPAQDDIRIAYVTLEEGQKFEWPDLLQGKKVAEEKEVDQWKEREQENQKTQEKQKHLLDVPFWFR